MLKRSPNMTVQKPVWESQLFLRLHCTLLTLAFDRYLLSTLDRPSEEARLLLSQSWQSSKYLRYPEPKFLAGWPAQVFGFFVFSAMYWVWKKFWPIFGCEQLNVESLIIVRNQRAVDTSRTTTHDQGMRLRLHENITTGKANRIWFLSLSSSPPCWEN